MAAGFTRAEKGLVATAAAIVFTRVFALSLTMPGFTEHARSLLPSGLANGEVLVGLAFGAYGVSMALAQLASGALSDRVGRRPVLLGGSALFVAGACGSALASSIWPLVLAQLLQGLGGVSSSAMAAVGETVPEGRRATAMALVGVPAGLGFFLGFVVGPVLGTAIGFVNLFWVTAALGLLACLPVLGRPLPAPLPGLGAPARNLALPVVSLALAGFTANFAMRAAMFDVQGAILDPLGTPIFAGMLVAAFAVMGLVTRTVDRSRSAWLAILVALVVLAVAAPLFRLPAATAAWPIAAAGVAFFAAHAVLSAVVPSEVSRLSGRSGGRGHGIQLAVAYLGGAAGALVAGWMRAHGLFGDTFLVLGAVAAAACLALVASRSPRGAGPRPAPAQEAQAP